MNTIQNYFKFNFIVLLIGININAYSCPLDKKDKIIISEFCPRLKLKKKKSLNSRFNLLIASTEDKKSIGNDAKTNFKISQKIYKNAVIEIMMKKIIKYFRVLISPF